MILDIKTTGQKGNDIVQIAYFIIDEQLNIKSEKNIIVNTNGKRDYYKMIPVEKIKNGYSLKNALEIFNLDFNSCMYVVGHNISFDLGILKKNLNDNKIKYKTDHKIICTMKCSRNHVNSKDKRGRVKNSRLGELYYFLFNKPLDILKQHEALYDVRLHMNV